MLPMLFSERYAFCSAPISRARTGLILRVMQADANLQNMERRLMGLQFPGKRGDLSPFLNNLMMASLHILDMADSSYILLRASLTSVLSSGQNCLSQATVNPSIPGAEAPFIEFISVSVSSESLSSPSASWNSCSEILLFRAYNLSRGFVSPSEFRKFSQFQNSLRRVENYILPDIFF